MGSEKKKSEKKTKPPIHEERWFEGFVVLSCLGLAWLLWQGLDTASPLAQLRALSAESLRNLTVARQLAEGQYSQVFSEADLPPMYPALLATLARLKELDLAGQNGLMALLSLAKNMNFYSFAASVVLVHLFVRTRLERPVSFLVTMLYTLSPLAVSTSFMIAPTLLYLVFSLAALVLTDRVFNAPDGKMWWMLLGACLLTAILCLPLGYILLLAFFIAGTRKLSLRKAMVPAVIVLMLSAPFLLRDAYYHYRPGTSTPALQDVLPALQQQTRPPKVEALARESSQSMLGSVVWGQDRLPLGGVSWLRWGVVALMALGLVYGFWSQSGIGSVYVLCGLVYTCFSASLSPQSFAPLLPLLLMYLYLGLLRLGDWTANVHVPLSRFSVPALSGLLMLAAASTYISTPAFIDFQKLDAPQAYLATLTPNYEAPRQSVGSQERVKRWLALNAPPNALVGHADESLVSSSRPRSSGNMAEDDALPNLLRMDYIVEQPGSPEIRQAFDRLLSQARKRFQLVYNDPQSGTRVWQVLGR